MPKNIHTDLFHTNDADDGGGRNCINCDEALVRKENVWFCPKCNSEELGSSLIFLETVEIEDFLYIQCPGATLYEEGSTEIKAGVKFVDDADPSQGYRIINHPVYAPTHTKRRRVKPEAVGRLRRCQGCQDYTIRMRRQEGPDFYIPNSKHPNRKTLKAVEYRTFE